MQNFQTATHADAAHLDAALQRVQVGEAALLEGGRVDVTADAAGAVPAAVRVSGHKKPFNKLMRINSHPKNTPMQYLPSTSSVSIFLGSAGC
jgi:hypothetical protein